MHLSGIQVHATLPYFISSGAHVLYFGSTKTQFNVGLHQSTQTMILPAVWTGPNEISGGLMASSPRWTKSLGGGACYFAPLPPPLSAFRLEFSQVEVVLPVGPRIVLHQDHDAIPFLVGEADADELSW